MTIRSGTFTTTGETSLTFFLRATETARVVLTITGSATITLDEIVGSTVVRTRETFTASTTGFDYVNTTPTAKVLLLRAASVSGSVAYSLSDVTGDQILQEWRRADQSLVARMTDEGFVGPVLTPAAQGGEVNIFDSLTPEQIADVTARTELYDLSSAINAAEAACAAGDTLVFPAGTYLANNLTGSRNFWHWRGEGFALIKNNANGDHFTHSGSDGTLRNLSFRADAQTPTYTGNGVVLSGARVKAESCEFLFYTGRCLKMTGDRPWAKDIYAITSTGAGYEAEFGLSGTARLYGICENLYTSQAVGGVLTVDCGSFRIKGGLFGKLDITAGTAPAGSNGGIITDSRILGAVNVGLSGAIFGLNQFGAIAFTWGSGTSGHWFVGNVEQTGFSMTNSGNLNSTILRANAGASGKIELCFGDDTSSSILKTVPNSDGLFEMKQLRFTNNFGAKFRNAADDADAASIIASASNNLSIQALVGSLQASVPSGQAHQFLVNAVELLRVNVNGVYPGGTTAFLSQGADTPEGAITAPVGSVRLRTNGGAVTSVYFKESGSGNTGWVAK